MKTCCKHYITKFSCGVLIPIVCFILNSCGVDLTCGNAPNLDYVNYNVESSHFPLIGSGQGIQAIGNKIYIYGDGATGTIQELDQNFDATGWVGHLTHNGINLISHPNGIAYKDGLATFVGTAEAIYQIDWEQFKTDGNLDNALINTISNYEGKYGSHPEYVLYNNQWFVASSYYEDNGFSGVALMDPSILATASNVGDDGVIKYRFSVTPFVQDLYWSSIRKQLVLVQNIKIWKGWRLTFIDLTMALSSNSGFNGAVMRTVCFPYDSELEGYYETTDGLELFLIGNELSYNFFYTTQ